MSNNHNNQPGKQKKKNQQKYQKPTQPIYRPPSARIESGPNLSFLSASTLPYNHPHDIFLIKQQSTSNSFGNVISNVFPIRGVLKRSKSFGNNNQKNCEIGNKPKYHFLDDTAVGTFFLTLENVSKENVAIIKQALNRETCAMVTMTHLLQIIRILCNKVLEKPNNANIVAKVCLEIHHNQHMSMIKLSDHKYLFLESLANCLREWFNERDKLRFTTGGARRWTAYITFLMEIYINLKEAVSKDLEFNKFYLSDSNDDEVSSEDEEDDLIDEFAMASNNNNNESSGNYWSQADSSSGKNGSSERCVKKTSSANSIEAKIISSLLAKQQKQFAHLLLDSFQVILSNPNSTPAEIECMQTVFRRCGKYLDEDNPSRIKALIFLIRDILLNYSNANQFINANNNSSLNSLISKNLLEIIELCSSGWKFNQAQQIYYFPYTKID